MSLGLKKMESQDPFEEINLGTGENQKPTYVSKLLDVGLQEKIISLLHEFKDYFAWEYEDMHGLSRELVEHRLPICEGKKPVKQPPRRFAPNVMEAIKAEIERLLKANFIRTTSYVDWISNIVPVIKKTGKLRVCVDFRDLNATTLKDEYLVPVVGILVDSRTGNEILSLLYGYSGYNQIYIAENDISKTAFRCLGTLGTYEWIVMPFV